MAEIKTLTENILNALNMILKNFAKPEMTFKPLTSDTKEQLIELAKVSKDYVKPFYEEMGHDKFEKMIYMILDLYKKSIGQKCFEIFQELTDLKPVKKSSNNPNSVNAVNSNTKPTMNTPDYKDIPGLADLLDKKKPL